MSDAHDKFHFDTIAVDGGVDRSAISGAAVQPIVRSTVFEVRPEFGYHDLLYPRLSTLSGQLAVSETMARLEGGEAGLVTASGMAAITTALLATLGEGGHVIAHRALYGGTHTFFTQDLARFGMSASLVDTTQDPTQWKAALRPNTRAIYVETMTNPLVEVPDHAAVVAFARDHGLVSMIDNTFATPQLYQPLRHGYDIVLHSATKYLNGHSDVAAGVVVTQAERMGPIKKMLDHLGGSIDPQAAYLLHRGVKTLGLRVRRQNETAQFLAGRLAAHPKVARVFYPGLDRHSGHERAKALFQGFGAMMAFEPKGGAAAATALIQRLNVILHSASLGGVESLVTTPATSSHAGMSPEERKAAGITDGLIRMSVGIEDPRDLVADLEQALESLTPDL